MKAYTKVGDLDVIATEPVKSPLSHNKNNPELVIHFKTQQKLLLSDGSEVFACLLCGDHTEEKAGKMRIHQSYYCPNREYTPVRLKNQPIVPSKNGHVVHEGSVDDILAALTLAQKAKDTNGAAARIATLEAELTKERANVTGLRKENGRMAETVAQWRDKYTKLEKDHAKLEGEVAKVREMLTELGILK